MQRLVQAFNPAAVTGLMCRNTLSVGFDGRLYDCDQSDARPRRSPQQGPHISTSSTRSWLAREIVTARHCFGRTAGAGCSCGGQTA